MDENETERKEKRGPPDQQSMGRLIRPPFLAEDETCASSAMDSSCYQLEERKPHVVSKVKNCNNFLELNICKEDEEGSTSMTLHEPAELSETVQEYSLGFPCKA